jgi:endonuclease/exonuclease/phosphatase family metal-dependent hydrolase
MKNLNLLICLCFCYTFINAQETSLKFKNNALKICSYNTFYGFSLGVAYSNKKQIEKAAYWLEQEDFDVVAYQELLGYNKGSFSKFAKKFNHNNTIFFERGPKDKNPQSIGISSVHPLELVEKSKVYDGYFIAKIKYSNLYFIVVHLRSTSTKIRKQESIAILDSYYRLIEECNNVVILGDFNALSEVDQNYNNYHFKEDLDKLIHDDRCHAKLNKDCNDWDYSVINTFIGDSLIVDTHDYMHKYNKQFDSIPRGTYPTKASHKIKNNKERDKKTHRIDYIFANKELAKYVTKSEIRKTYFNEAREEIEMDDLSDHYPIITEFDFSSKY